MIRKKRVLALALAALCLLGGCGGGEDGEEPVRKVDTVKVSSAYFGMAYYQNGSFNPVTDGSSINRLVGEALYEGLFEIGENFTAVPLLCETYTGDGASFSFTLRDDVTFWSGAALTAADVAASLQAAKNSETSPYRSRLTEVSSITARDARTVEITLDSPNINLPRLLDIPVYRDGTAGEEFAEGTGPFRPEQDGSQWKLVANEGWHGGFLGSIRTITLVSMVRADAAVSSFETGDVSLMRKARISPQATAIGGSVDTVQTPSADLHYLGVNYGNAALQNAKVRQALSAAIGRRALCDTQLQTFADPAVLPVNPQPTDSDLTPAMEADPERAARLLAEAELEEPLTLTLLVNSDNAFKTAAADQIAAAWNALEGVTVTVSKQPYETFVSEVQSGAFDLYYGETLLTPDFDLRPLLSGAGSLNYGGYSSETVSAAVAAARRGEDTATLYRLLLEEMPLIPLAFEREQLILRKGLIDNFCPAPYNAFAGLEMWTSK